MTKRSKVLLIVFIAFLFVTLVSVVIPNRDSQKGLDEFESEIVDPNNQLEPLSNSYSSMFLIDLAMKIEVIISKIVGFFIDGLAGLIKI